MPLVSFRADRADHPASLRRLIAARWLLIALAAALSLLVPPLLAIDLPWRPIFAVLAVMAALNLVAAWRLRRQAEIGPDDVFSHLLFDTASLAALIFLSGGVTNPMIALLLPPVAVAALTLPARRVAVVGAVAIGAYSLLLNYYLPLAIADAGRATRLHLFGMWLSFALSAVLIAWFIVRMTALIRERDAALAAAREQSLRDERVLAIGTLAAGAAHELGTPLGTMALIAGELARDPDLPAAVRGDVAVLREQLAVCKDIVTGLSQRAGAERLENIERRPVDVWLEGQRRRWQALWPTAHSVTERLGEGEAPPVPDDPRLAQALQNLFNNAVQAAGAARETPIRIALDWRDEGIRIDIRDQGPGFPPAVLAAAGRHAFPAHAQGSGVGLMLTHSVIEQLGGRLELHNPPDGGALASVFLPPRRTP